MLTKMSRIPQKIEEFNLYIESFLGSIKDKRKYSKVETFFLFIGNPRSGHTLVSSILDAHPNIICDSTEQNIISLVKKGFTQEQIFYILQKRANQFAKLNKLKTGYSYEITNSYQGNFELVKAIGVDFIAFPLAIQENPILLNSICNKIFNCNIKFIHIIRNPFDAISTMTKKNKLNLSLDDRINFYSKNCEAVYNLQNRLNQKLFLTIKHEDFVFNPNLLIQKMGCFLNIEFSKDQIVSYSSIVNSKPNKTRNNITWSNQQIKAVNQIIEKYYFLEGYNYND